MPLHRSLIRRSNNIPVRKVLSRTSVAGRRGDGVPARKRTVTLLPLGFLLAVAALTQFEVHNMPLAGQKQSYVLPAFRTQAFTEEIATKPAIDMLLASRAALPDPSTTNYHQTQAEILRHQLNELEAFMTVVSQRGQATLFLGSLAQDLADQVMVGAISNEDFATVSGKVKALAAMSQRQMDCLAEAQTTKAALLAGLNDRAREAETHVASARNLVAHIQGKDVISRCAKESEDVVNATGEIVRFRDDHVAQFNALASRQKFELTMLQGLLALAFFVFGNSVRKGAQQAWKTITRPSPVKPLTRLRRWGTRPVRLFRRKSRPARWWAQE